ncbi:MAG: hypothetical protein JWQ03_619 [Variovorax sp.]|nr:hypothetical protein [Variovorax sp.]
MTGIPLLDLAGALNAMERALDDDRAHRVTLPKDTYFALSRAHGALETRIKQLGIEVPVENKEVSRG